jgi:hypothetical protein
MIWVWRLARHLGLVHLFPAAVCGADRFRLPDAEFSPE